MMDRICRRELFSRLRAISIRNSICSKQFSTSLTRAAKPPKKTIKTHQAQLEYKPKTVPQKPHSISPDPPPAPPNPLKYRKVALIICVFAGTALVGKVSYHAFQLRNASTTSVPKDAASQADVSSRYNSIASSFDASIDRTEWWMGLPSKRKKLVSWAHGDVLEVSIGTGRNLEYYDWDFKGFNGVGKIQKGGLKRGTVRSFTAVDKSPEMLEIAHEKFSTLYPGILGIRWIVGDASETIPPPPKNANERSGNLEGKKYDTIIQTMGLCSVEDPVKLLKNLGEMVKEEEGRILLLEHGRGRWEWVNKFLDIGAEGHAKGFGCWWNRDLAAVVDESGLVAVKVKRWHAGTTWMFELKKPKSDSGEKVIEKLNEVKTALTGKEGDLVKVENKPEKLVQRPEAKVATAGTGQIEEPKKKGWW